MLLSVMLLYLEMAKLHSASPREIALPFPHAIISKLHVITLIHWPSGTDSGSNYYLGLFH